MTTWQDISTAPKDGTPFFAWQNGEIFHAKYFTRGKPELAFRTHQLHVESHHRVMEAEIDGKKVRAKVPINEPWDEEFRHDWCFWTRGFEFSPTHWMPLPEPPESKTP